jgi:hypothetical protein
MRQLENWEVHVAGDHWMRALAIALCTDQRVAESSIRVALLWLQIEDKMI